MFRTTLRVPQMDCAAEEQMIRMKLAQDTTIKRLDVDLPSRQLVVIHAGNDADIERAIRELRLDVEVIAHEAADDVLEDADETSQRHPSHHRVTHKPRPVFCWEYHWLYCSFNGLSG